MARSRSLGYGEGTVYQEAGGRWRGELRIGTQRRRVSGRTRSEAVTKLDRLRSTVADGLPMGDDTRLGPWLDWYLNAVVVHKHPNTLSSYRWAVAQSDPLHGKRLRDLSVDDVERLLADLSVRTAPKQAKARRGGQKGALGTSSLKRVRMVLGAALHEAERREMINRNVARLAYLPATAAPPKSKRSLTRQQVQALKQVAPSHRDGVAVMLTVTMGLRPGEVLGLPWNAVDLKSGTLTVKQALVRLPGSTLVIEPPKVGSSRQLKMPDFLVASLKSHRSAQRKERMAAPAWEDTGLIFTTKIGTPIDQSNFRRSVDSLLLKIGEDDFSPNELRHTAVSLLVDAGVHLQEVADFVGHTDVRMLATAYRHKVRPVVDVTASQDLILATAP